MTNKEWADKTLPELKKKLKELVAWRRTAKPYNKAGDYRLSDMDKMEHLGQTQRDIMWIEEGMPKNFYPYGGVNSIAIERRNIIKRALSEGKPVPEEVLADYPELTKKLPAEAEIEVVKDIPEALEPSMSDKLNEATNLAVELAFEDLEKGIPRDTDKIFGEELSNKIGPLS